MLKAVRCGGFGALFRKVHCPHAPTAAVIDADFVGVDLMPTTDGRLFVLELNGAVEFDDNCALDSRSVPEATADALGLVASVPPRRGTRRATHRSVNR